MRRLSVSLLILLAAPFTFAQTSSNPPNVSKDLPVPKSTAGQVFANYQRLSGNFGCPVGFTASRQATGQIMSAGDTRRPGPVQGLHLTLKNLTNMPAIESIEVTVYGTSQKGLYLPASTPSTDTVSKTFELHRTSDDASLTDANVWMHLAGSLRWADLISITYADGTTWQVAEDVKCRAVPSNFVLVGSK